MDPSGARQWVQRLVIRGRPRMLGLGGYPLVSLAEARNAAFVNRQRARAGGDPLAEKHHGHGVPTADVLAILTPIWHEKAQTAQRDHRVPLSSRALVILHDVQKAMAPASCSAACAGSHSPP